MSVSITECPSCKTTLPNDTSQCPNCDEVIDQAPSARQESKMDTSTIEEDAERPCSECGELVRAGMVRCWNCSTFMRSEIAALYQQMQSSDRPVIYSQPQMDRADLSILEDAEEIVAGDSEFELSAEINLETSSKSDTPKNGSANSPRKKQESQSAEEAIKASEEEQTHSPSEKSEHNDESREFIDEFVKSSTKRSSKKSREKIDGVRVYCPNGHRIVVQERHRGLTGRCPKCKSSFVVPECESGVSSTKNSQGEQNDDSSLAGKFKYWAHDVSYHEINPERLRLKTGSMKNTAQSKDLAFSEDSVLIVSLDKKGGKVANKTKANEIRAQIHQHLKENGKPDKVPVGSCESISLEDFKKALKIVLPTDNPEDSMFAGIPVFGEQRIVVRIPAKKDSKEHRFLSLSLSTYRQLNKILTSFYDMKEFGAGIDIPLQDEFREFPCFYTSEMVRFLKGATEYHEADPAYKLKLAGRQCSACKMVVSEEARKKEKFGGSGGKALAKTHCPKCQKLFGTGMVYDIDQVERQPEIEEPEENDDQL